MVEIAPMFRRSTFDAASNWFLNFSSPVIAVTTSVGPIDCNISFWGTWTTLAYGHRNSRLERTWSIDSQYAIVGLR